MNSKNFKSFTFPILKQVFPELIATELVSVQPMGSFLHKLDGPIKNYFGSKEFGIEEGYIDEYWIHNKEYSKEEYYKHPLVILHQKGGEEAVKMTEI